MIGNTYRYYQHPLPHVERAFPAERHTRPYRQRQPRDITVYGADDVPLFASMHCCKGEPGSQQPHIYLLASIGANLQLAAAECGEYETIGTLYGEAGRWNGNLAIFITGAFWTRFAEASTAEVQISPEQFMQVYAHEDEYWPRRRRIGWFHSHPGWGLFFSSRDIETQHSNFNMSWQIGLLLETHTAKAAYYYWDQKELLAGPQVFSYEEVIARLPSVDRVAYHNDWTVGQGQPSYDQRHLALEDIRNTGDGGMSRSLSVDRDTGNYLLKVFGRQRGEQSVNVFDEALFTQRHGREGVGSTVLIMDRILAADLVRYMEQIDPSAIFVGYLGGETFAIERDYILVNTALVGYDRRPGASPGAGLWNALRTRWRQEMGVMAPLATLSRCTAECKPWRSNDSAIQLNAVMDLRSSNPWIYLGRSGHGNVLEETTKLQVEKGAGAVIQRVRIG